MQSYTFVELLLTMLLFRNGVRATTPITLAARFVNETSSTQTTCTASCYRNILTDHAGLLYWASISLSTTYTHTVILIVDEEHHTTSTITSTVAIPDGVTIYTLLPTNDAGTVTTNIGTTVLTYPTGFVDYPSGYYVQGTFESSGTCLSDPYISWDPKVTSSLTQPSFAFPSGGDQYGIFYTVAVGETGYPDGWDSARSKDQLAWQVCTTIAMSPAEALTAALVLTTTSVSTMKNTKITSSATPAATAQASAVPTTTKNEETNNAAPSSTLADAVKSTPSSQATQSSNVDSKAESTDATKTSITVTTQTTAPATATQLITIGSSTVLVSYQKASPSGTSTTSSAAIVIGTQTVAIGSTVTVNGVTMVATTGSNSAPQIIYGTNTVSVAQTTRTGIGSYIISGLGGPSSSSPAQFTGAASRAYSSWKRELWGCLGLAVLSLFG